MLPALSRWVELVTLRGAAPGRQRAACLYVGCPGDQFCDQAGVCVARKADGADCSLNPECGPNSQCVFDLADPLANRYTCRSIRRLGESCEPGKLDCRVGGGYCALATRTCERLRAENMPCDEMMFSSEEPEAILGDDCQLAFECRGNAPEICQPRRKIGEVCERTVHCEAGFCKDGFCAPYSFAICSS